MARKSFKKLAEGDVKARRPIFPEGESKRDLRALGAKHLPDARLVPIDRIEPDPDQPRKTFDEESIDSLAESIKAYGVLQPLNVSYSEDRDVFLIINGERRYRASRKAGLTSIPCIVREGDDGNFERQLIENLQREDLPVLEEASGIRKLIKEHRKTQQEASRLIGKSQAYISSILKILELPRQVIDDIPGTKVSKDFLFHLAKIKDAEETLARWKAFKEGSLETKQLKKEVSEKKNRGRPRIKPWTWKSKDFTVSIRFRKNEYDDEKVIEALTCLIDELKSDRGIAG